MGKRINIIFIVILILGVILRLKGVTNPYLDDQGWRQADTASMALNMLGHLGNFPDVFFPMLNYDGVGPQPVELEFPFLPYLLAWTWEFLGWQDMWGRLWAICFSLLTIWGVFKLGKMALSEKLGLWAAALYTFFPLTTYYGRVVMPEPVAQAFSVWALVAIFSWRKGPSLLGLFISGLLMAGAVLAKLPQLMILPVALVWGFYPFRGNVGKMLLYSAVALFLPMLYYSWVHLGAGAASQFVSGILSYQVLENQTGYAHTLYKNLKHGLGFSWFLALAGAVFMFFRRPFQNPFSLGLLLWLAISFVYLGVICLKIPLDYYLVPIALPLALLAGYTLVSWGDEGKSDLHGALSFVVGILMIFLLCFNQIWYYDVKYRWDKGSLTQAQWLRQHTEKDSILLLSGSPPMILYYSQRYGYRLNSDDTKAWEDVHSLPGDYLVALPDSRGEEFWQQVEASFPQVGPGVYKLK